MNSILYALTALLYSGLALAAWRANAQLAPASLFERALLLAALVAHGALLHATVFPRDAMFFGFAFALSAMLWLGVGIYWIESCFLPLDSLRRFALPVAAVASLLPLAFPGGRVLPYAANPLFKLHFIVANTAYGLFALIALHAILMLFVERKLHAAHPAAARCALTRGGWLDTLPPLLTLEKLLFQLIGAGFALLTFALLSGIIFSEQLLDQALRFDHKTVFALLSWWMFGAVLAGRRWYGWRGRAALRWVLAAYIALLLAYIGSRFVLEVLLRRSVI